MGGVVQCQLLGRFGNMLHQYVAGRAYAELFDAQLETPSWIGQPIFGLNEPNWSRELPVLNDGNCGGSPENDVTTQWGRTDIRLGGYFLTQNWIDLLRRAQLKRWLQVQPSILNACLSGPQRPCTVAHLRRGDYVNHPLYCTVSISSYHRTVETYCLPNIVWVTEEHPRGVALPPDYSFVGDFVTMFQADVLLRANSTFSWWAATLSDADVYAPVVEDKVGDQEVEFVRGNWPRTADVARVGINITDLYLRD